MKDEDQTYAKKSNKRIQTKPRRILKKKKNKGWNES